MKISFPRALFAAIALHVAVGGGAALYARTLSFAPGVAGNGFGTLFEVAIDEMPLDDFSPEVPEAPAPTPGPGVVPRDHQSAKYVPTVTPEAPGEPRPPGGEGAGPGAVLNPSGTDPNGIPGGSGTDGSGPGGVPTTGTEVGRGPINLGLDRKMAWMWTRPERAAPAPRPASTSGGLHEALDDNDRVMGHGFGGPVVTAFHSAAYRTSAPQVGWARFEAVIDASGHVQSVRLVSVNGERASWQAVAQRVLALLRSKVLRVPPNGNGLAIVVDVRSRFQLPSGSNPGEAIKLQGPGVAFDVADVGASPTHNVAVSVVAERRL